MDLPGKFSATINHCHNILQIVAHAEIILAAPMERFQLGREKISGGDEPKLKVADPDSLRIFEGGSIPDIAEAENRRVGLASDRESDLHSPSGISGRLRRENA